MKVSAKYWTAAPELWQKPLSTCFFYRMCSYKTVKVHRLHWSGASGMEKKSPWMSVLSLLKLIWHLLNKCSISLVSSELFCQWQGQQANAAHLKEAHFSWPAMLIRASMHTVAEVRRGWILLKKKTCGPYQGVTSVWGDPAACHVENVWLEECAGVCLCVCSSTHIDVTADWDFLS